MEMFTPTITTGEALAEIGRRLERYRLQQNRTATDVAGAAGISTRTLARAEAGENPTLATVIQILRALGRLEALDSFLPPPLVSPMQLVKLRGHQRRRAGTPRRSSPDG